jgi:hypothetical protein
MKNALTLVIAAIILCSYAQPSLAASSTGLAQTFDTVYVQSAAPDPLLSFTIASDASTTISLKDSRNKKYTWIGLSYNGTATCIARLMATTTKASYPPIPVAQDTMFSRAIGRNAIFLNYSGCVGTTASVNGTRNSVVEIN